MTSTPNTTVERAKKFLELVGVMLEKKNAQYGDSLSNPVRIFSRSNRDEQIRVRIDDKLSRIARGVVEDDEDVVADLCGYLAMYAATRESE